LALKAALRCYARALFGGEGTSHMLCGVTRHCCVALQRLAGEHDEMTGNHAHPEEDLDLAAARRASRAGAGNGRALPYKREATAAS
jgi:hypothetical protein